MMKLLSICFILGVLKSCMILSIFNLFDDILPSNSICNKSLKLISNVAS